MAKKVALLIGVDDYGMGLKSLRCPTNGVAAMRSVLRNPEIGGFDQVVALMDPDVGEMRSRICEIFAHLKKEDMVLFYFTGHGIKDMSGDFYLTTTQSELFESGRPNAGTAVEAHFLKRELSNSWAERKVVILDCCFGAAFADGFLAMNDSSVDIASHFGGKGWCVMTSSTSSRYALEQEGESLSIYTRYLIEGLKTGGAALDGQDFISAQNLHDYVKSQIKVAAPAMEPAMFNAQEGQDIVIAKVQLNNEQRYRKQVQQKVRNGDIGPAGKAVLMEWRQRLGLNSMQAKAIEDEILQPYRERQRHLALYTKALEEEKARAYPLTEVALKDLKELQRLLSLQDEDVRSIGARILNTPSQSVPPVFTAAAPAPSQNLAPPSGELRNQLPPTRTYTKRESQPQPVWAASSRTSSSQTSSSRAVSAQGAPSVAVAVEPPPLKPLPIREWVRSKRVKIRASKAINQEVFTFQTIQVNERGDSIKKIRRKATYFTESLGKNVSLDMVRIPAGRFLMGPTVEESENEQHAEQREVAIKEFWFGKYTITQDQWWAVMEREPLSPRSTSSVKRVQKPLQPIENIFWTDAVEFCQRLSQKTGRTYQLPSGAQWEYACRAGTTTPFYFGETLTPEIANYNGNYAYGEGPKGRYRETSTEVGCFAPNAYGLYDMHGNMWEWCLDGWHGLQNDPLNTQNASSRFASQKKSLRGGSWFYLPTNCRSAYSLTYPFHNRTDDISFRIVCLHPNAHMPKL
ncbi:MAG: SUMF1/EgtB/PvdO family nonheme iron enzyme [Cyanobacteria bacterium P01_D01_bin.1]